jgi:release factor glutamine methyltransferase
VSGAPTVAAALQAARAAGVERLDARLLLAFVLGRPAGWLLAHDDAPLGADEQARFQALLARRAAGEPVAYLMGRKEFFGLELHVGPDVLVPRPDTETLVEWALDGLAPDAPARALDLGTGSGAIALALAQRRPLARVTAVDASAAALAVATDNGHRLGLAVEWLHGDWFAPVAGRRFELVVSNPPYVAEGDPHLPALAHEPLAALVSGPQGLDALRRIAADAPAHLEAGGRLLLEHGHDQAPAVAALLADAGFVDVGHRRDLAGRPRCTGGRWPG